MKIKRELVRKPRVEMVPLLDCFFLVLAFFIYSMFSMTIQRGLPVRLPSATTATIDNGEFVTITIKRDGAILLDDATVDTSTLASLLWQKREKKPDIQVNLRADKDVTYQQAIEVMDLVRYCGIQRLTLETQWKER